MTYNLDDLKLRIKKKQSEFRARLILLYSLVLICVLLMTLSSLKSVILISGICVFVLVLLLIKLFDKYKPKVLFSKEIKGINIKESDYEIMKRGSYTGNGMRHKQIGAKGTVPYAPNTGANKKAFHKDQHFSAEVYLREENGNVIILQGLYLSQLEIYEEGDLLLKPAGAKFPIVINRNAPRQPCPLCGEINKDEDFCCGCGLEIIKGDSL